MGLVVAPHFVQSWSSGMVLIGFVVADLFQNRAHIRKKKKMMWDVPLSAQIVTSL